MRSGTRAVPCRAVPCVWVWLFLDSLAFRRLASTNSLCNREQPTTQHVYVWGLNRARVRLLYKHVIKSFVLLRTCGFIHEPSNSCWIFQCKSRSALHIHFVCGCVHTSAFTFCIDPNASYLMCAQDGDVIKSNCDLSLHIIMCVYFILFTHTHTQNGG